jgi:hypothetical protein
VTTLVSLLSGALSASLVLAGVVGLAVHRRDALWSFSVVLCIYSLVTTFVALGHPRFRDAADHLLLYYAAYLLTHWRAYLASVRSGDALVRRRLWFAAAAAVYIVTNWGWIAFAKASASTGL